MSQITEILEKAKQEGASDVHITVGIPPKMRVNGKLITMDEYGKMLPKDTAAIAEEIMSEKQLAVLDDRATALRPRNDVIGLHLLQLPYLLLPVGTVWIRIKVILAFVHPHSRVDDIRPKR